MLEELGALAEAAGAKTGPAGNGTRRVDRPADAGQVKGWQLTPIGRELARLPVDPTVGRMILQASTEKCLREVLVIAAGLSIQDPRERPLDRQAQADAAHRRFAHPDSDFLTLLNIWEAFHDEFEAMSQGRMRRFCHEHFLSYIRMREWRDIHDQLLEVLEERDDFKTHLDLGRTPGKAKSQGGSTKDQGPSTKYQGPRTKFQGPDPQAQTPNARTENPNAKTQIPKASLRDPNRKSEIANPKSWTSARPPIGPSTGASWPACWGTSPCGTSRTASTRPRTTARWRCFPARRCT